MRALLLRACDEWRPHCARVGGACTATLALETALPALRELSEAVRQLPPPGAPGGSEAAAQLRADAGAVLGELEPLLSSCRLPSLGTLQVGVEGGKGRTHPSGGGQLAPSGPC